LHPEKTQNDISGIKTARHSWWKRQREREYLYNGGRKRRRAHWK